MASGPPGGLSPFGSPPGFPPDGFPPGFSSEGLPPGLPPLGLPGGLPSGSPSSTDRGVALVASGFSGAHVDPGGLNPDAVVELTQPGLLSEGLPPSLPPLGIP